MAEITVERLDQLVRREREACDDITSWLRSGVMARRIPAENAAFLSSIAEDNRDATVSLLTEISGILREEARDSSNGDRP